jgi:hypothetical protein
VVAQSQPSIDTVKALVVIEPANNYERRGPKMHDEFTPQYQHRIDKMTDEDKAEAFDKLFACDRVRVLGYACRYKEGTDGPIKHIGMELWEAYPGFKNTTQKDILLDFLTETPPGDKYKPRKGDDEGTHES